MSLRLRVVLAVSLVMLLAAALGLAVAGLHARDALAQEMAAALAGGRQTVAAAFEDLPRSDHPTRDLVQLVADFDGDRHLSATLVDARGRILATSRPTGGPSAPAWFTALLETRRDTARLPTPAQGAILLATRSADDVGALWAEFTGVLTVMGATLTAGCVLVWFGVGRALAPLGAFSAAFRRIGAGDYAVEIPAGGPSELSRLGVGVAEMARRLAAMRARNLALEDQMRALQDEERADLARDLHDEIGPHLFAMNVDAAMASRRIEEGAAADALPRIAAMRASIGHIQRLVRDILGRLRPTELIEMGLEAAVEELVAFWRARQAGTRFVVSLPGSEEAIPARLRETVYRVVQEGLNNAVRHGRPSRVEVAVAVEGGLVVAGVTDDGAGLSAPGAPGLGLTGMRERVAAVGGSLDTGPGEGSGWRVTARLPIIPDGGEAAA